MTRTIPNRLTVTWDARYLRASALLRPLPLGLGVALLCGRPRAFEAGMDRTGHLQTRSRGRLRPSIRWGVSLSFDAGALTLGAQTPNHDLGLQLRDVRGAQPNRGGR